MIQVLHGDSISVLKEMEKETIDTVYMCPSPFGYYENEPDYVGGEHKIVDYIDSIIKICNSSFGVLKKSGNLFVQVPDVFTPFGNLASIPSYFEMLMVKTGGWTLNDRLIWHRTETNRKPRKPEAGFIKNWEMIFHFIIDEDHFYFNEKSKYVKTSVFSYPLEDTYYTNEFDSGLPYQLSEMVIDTTVPKGGIILDPLCGSGKVGVVAKKMNRDFIGIDINLETVEACRIRLGL
jgi:DNA modification methylase